MGLDRRGFLGGAAGLLMAGTGLEPRVQAQSDEGEPTAFLMISDTHVLADAADPTRLDPRCVAVTERFVDRLNGLVGMEIPEQAGGGRVRPLRGVIHGGDCIDTGDKPKVEMQRTEWAGFEQYYGLTGRDGRLQLPLYEVHGNHDSPRGDGYAVQRIRERNKNRPGLTAISENGLHYSWDWGGVHFVQTNLYPADRQHPKVRYSLPWHDPQGALTFLREDLAASVGTSGRPVVVASHCGVDTDWWHPEDWAEFHKAVGPYNVIAYFYGHSGTGLRKFRPAEGDKPIDCVNTGQTEKGFFACQVTPSRLRLAYHAKKDPRAEKPEWEWKYMLDKPLGRGN